VKRPVALVAALVVGATAPATGADATGRRAFADFAAALPGAMAPRLTPATDGLLLTWIEPLPPPGEPATRSHRLRFARFRDQGWSPPVTIAYGPELMVNWADFPSVAEGRSGVLLAHWLETNGGGRYAYGIRLARSEDGGARWRPLGWLHDDGTPTEHGFVSLLPDGDGFRALWLDGRGMAGGGPMALRTAVVKEAVGPSAVIDERVCDCCQTSAVRTSAGALVAYRDRSDGEVRDISTALVDEGGWSLPREVHGDGWVIPGCPVNGPALAAAGDHVALGWFTATEGDARVLLAWSRDGGRSFGPPVRVSSGGTVGRVAVAAGEGGAVISWIALEEGRGVLYLRRVSATGALGAPHRLGMVSGGRGSGFPQLVHSQGRLYMAWVEGVQDEVPPRLRLAELPLADLPAPLSSP
jgi:hypothetical protein